MTPFHFSGCQAVVAAAVLSVSQVLGDRAFAQVVISEFVASNSTSLLDEDRDASDWIELHNTRSEPVSVAGYTLTDDPDDVTRWTLPSVTIPGKGYLVVFASGKDRKPADGGELHTNFQLSSEGEYLALARPDGETLESVFAPAYPPQRSDTAYGSGTPSTQSTVITTGAGCRWFVPTTAEQLAAGWRDPGFDDSAWRTGNTGLGYQYDGLIGEGGNTRDAMLAVNASVFVRIPFVIDDAAAVTAMVLRMKFEDGFVAYLNGRRIAGFNAPDPVTWDAVATGSHPDALAVEFENFSVDFAGALADGANILAIQGMNTSSGGSDLLVLPELDVTSASGEATVGYLTTPTPGAPNGSTIPGFLAPPAFSVTRGHYAQPVTLELTTPDRDAIIYYTDDGDAPGAGDTRYTGPIPIEQTTVIRAISTRGEEPPSPIATHTYLFVADILQQGPLHSRNTAMISESGEYGPLMEQSLLALPSVCISMDGSKPSAREDAVSIELFDPAGGESGFQIDAGIKLVGGHSVSSPKNNWRVMFRGEYGAASLNYPLFDGHPYSRGATDGFRRLMFRSGSHDTFFWLGESGNPPSGGRRSDASYLRNRWINDISFLMGHQALHGRFVQMFINGNYHGQYHIMEWPNDDFHASYFGGDAVDHHYTNGADRNKTGSDHGNGDTWWASWADMKSRVRGNDFGAAEELVDTVNLADYMLLSFYAGNTWDWNPNQNWMAGGPKTPGAGGWKFYNWDCDIIFQDVNGNNLGKNVPDGVFADMVRRHEEFRVLVRDRIYKHFFHGGVLTPARVGEVLQFRAGQIRDSIVAETARWQPSSPARRPWDRDGEWQAELDHMFEVYFPQRTGIVLDQLRRTRVGGEILYPVEVPEFSLQGGAVEAGYKPALIADAGSIYYTTDGSDPRLPGGDISPAARVFAGGVEPATFIGRMSTWRYLDDGSNQGAAWRQPGFDDGAWQEGAGEFGYGDGDEATIIDFGGDPADKHITTYFRRTFTLPSAADVTELSVGLLRDDGAVVYVNGIEVVRDAMPAAGGIAYDTPASSSAGSSEESTYFAFEVPPGVLVDGANVIAVEVHQNSVGSSDMSFDLDLTGKMLTSGGEGLVIRQDTVVRMRALEDDTWSGLNEALFTVGESETASFANIVVSEIHYNPYGDDDLEFVELRNTTDRKIDLSGSAFVDGIGFTFPLGATLLPQRSLVLAGDAAAFAAAFPEAMITGTFTGNLANGGERLTLVNGAGAVVFSFSFNDKGSWPGRADGAGSSLELKGAGSVPASADERNDWLGAPGNWRSSSEFQGSPGWDGSGPDNRVVINEVLASPLAGQEDSIELRNNAETAVDLAGWFLSDSPGNYRKFTFAGETTLQPGAYLVLDGPPLTTAFGLNGTLGDDVYLVEADSSGKLLRFVDHVDFPAAVPGETYGRWPDGNGGFYPMELPTLGVGNATGDNRVRIGPFAITQIHYNPDGADEAREFVVIGNGGGSTENLAGWRLRGEVDFDFDAVPVVPGGRLVLVGFDPAVDAQLQAFRAAYPMSPDTIYAGPWRTGSSAGGKLDDGGGTLRLWRAGEAELDGDGGVTVPLYLEDRVAWNDADDWPQAADGAGLALHRVLPFAPGDLASSWIAGEPFGVVGEESILPGYTQWAAAAFPADLPEPLRRTTGDPDGDGVTNGAEYAFVGNPLRADAATSALAVALNVDGQFAGAFRVRTAPELDYRVAFSDDLVTWSEIAEDQIVSVADAPLSEEGTAMRTLSIRIQGATGYYRITASARP